jgi:hypothetical protein
LHRSTLPRPLLASLLPIVAACVLAAPLQAGAGIVYTIDRFGPTLRVIDPSTAATTSSVPVTLAGQTIAGGVGLAANPLTGELWALLRFPGDGGESPGARELVTIDPATGVATSIGATGNSFAELAFDPSGTLYAVTGDGATPPETLYTLSTSDASSTFVLTLGNGDDGEVIAWNPVDGLLYHASGLVELGPDGRILETIDPVGLGVNPVALSGSTYVEATGLTWSSDAGLFLLTSLDLAEISDELFTLTASGQASFVGALDHEAGGVAFVPEPSTAFLLSFGLVALGARGRRRH